MDPLKLKNYKNGLIEITGTNEVYTENFGLKLCFSIKAETHQHQAVLL